MDRMAIHEQRHQQQHQYQCQLQRHTIMATINITHIHTVVTVIIDTTDYVIRSCRITITTDRGLRQRMRRFRHRLTTAGSMVDIIINRRADISTVINGRLDNPHTRMVNTQCHVNRFPSTSSLGRTTMAVIDCLNHTRFLNQRRFTQSRCRFRNQWLMKGLFLLAGVAIIIIFAWTITWKASAAVWSMDRSYRWASANEIMPNALEVWPCREFASSLLIFTTT